MAYLDSKNPFACDDNDDDEFLRRGTRYNTAGDDSYGNKGNTTGTGSRYDDLLQLQKESMSRQLESTSRCMASIYDSEAIGVATAEELVRQGEQLDNVEAKVEKMNADTRVSQRHLNGIKSIFGGLKNWWQGEDKKPATVASKPPPRNSALRDTIDASQDRVTTSRSTDVHPAMRLKSDGAMAGFYDDDLDGKFSSSGGRDSYYQEKSGGAMSQQQQQQVGRSAMWNEYESNLNKNLEEMSSGLSRLKMLGLGLNDEIVAQNDQIDRIMPKVDRVDTKLKDQNRQMRQILGKEK